ncbi:MAG TPA: ABC transporter substrate-binding protein [Polyangia bacterium]|nr:ABC transporter substrate-binding protein [Polyangia bacterium]
MSTTTRPPNATWNATWNAAAAALILLGCHRAPATPPAGGASAPPTAAANTVDYGKPGEPIHLTVGYQPYYAEAWSGAVVNGLALWKKHLPPGSTVDFSVGLQGALIVNAMLAGKQQIGYVGDMPGIVGATKREVADLRIVANIGLGHDQCNVFFARPDAPAFASPQEALRWLNGKTVAVPKGSCSDRFARAVFKKNGITPAEYLNQNIELITSGFRAHKLDAAVVWEPVASRLVSEKLARRVATGNQFGENDGALIDVRADLIQQRPDVLKAWLETELEAEQILADPARSHEVVALLKKQTTGFDEKTIWQALFGSYPTEAGGGPVRLTIPFAFTEQSLELIQRSTAFLFEVKSIAIPKLAPDAILPDVTAQILKERGLQPPVAQIKETRELPTSWATK